jgi:erythromycin esterase-like protein
MTRLLLLTATTYLVLSAGCAESRARQRHVSRQNPESRPATAAKSRPLADKGHAAALTPITKISGVVRDPDGSPVGGATVSLVDGVTSVPTLFTTSDDNGFFSISGPPLAYKVTVAHHAFVGVQVEATRDARPTILRMSVELEKGGYLFEGRVESASSRRPSPVTFVKDFGKLRYSVLPQPDGAVVVRLPSTGYLLLAETRDLVSYGAYVESGKPFVIRAETSAFVEQPPSAAALQEIAGIARTLETAAGYGSIEREAHGPAIIGLGEAVHGAAESTQVRMAVTRALVRHRPVTIVLEANWASVLPAEEYIHGGAGDPVAIAKGLRFYMWRNQEFAEALVELRAHNSRAKHKIHVVGMDVQDPASNVATIQTCPKGREVLRSMPWLSAANGRPTPDEIAKAVSVVSSLRSASVAWSPKHRRCSSAALHDAATVLLQHLRIRSETDPFVQLHLRDEAMAHNVARVAQGAAKSAVVVWAHNAHVSRRGIDGQVPMGKFLHEAGARYVPVGMIVHSGTFNARLPDHDYKLGVVSFPAPSEVFLAAHLAAVAAADFTIDLRSLSKSGEAWKWFDRPAHAWESGGPFFGVENSAETRIPAVDFDILVYLHTIHPSHFLQD